MDELGPLQIVLRRGSRAVNIVLLTIGLGLTGSCVVMSFKALEALAGLFLPFVILAIAWWGLRHRVCLHEHGVEVFGFVGSKRIRFDQTESLSYRSVGQSVNGIPTGTYVNALLEGAGRKVGFNLRAGKAEAEPLEQFRSRISSEIANRNWSRLQNGEASRWGYCASLGHDGLRYRKSGFLGRKPEVLLDYRSGLRHAFGGGRFSIFPAQGDKPLLTMSCDEPNFFPGFVLFTRLTGPGTPESRERGRAVGRPLDTRGDPAALAMSETTSRDLSMEFFCDACGRLAARIVTRPPYGHVEIVGFLYTVHFGLGGKGGSELADAVRSGDAGRLFAIDEMCAPFYCSQCTKSYCSTDWHPANPHSSDVTHGWCPLKHHRLVDD
jgi:hypothetical protein